MASRRWLSVRFEAAAAWSIRPPSLPVTAPMDSQTLRIPADLAFQIGGLAPQGAPHGVVANLRAEVVDPGLLQTMAVPQHSTNPACDSGAGKTVMGTWVM